MRHDAADTAGRAAARSRLSVRRLLPLVAIAAGIAVFFVLGLDSYVSLEAFERNHEALKRFVADNPVLSGVGYMAIYAAAVALSLPGGLLMSVVGGFLFGPFLGSALIVVGATAGATALFLAAKTGLGDLLRERVRPWLGRFEKEFQENALSYFLAMRLIPIFPFFVVNLVPAFLGMGLTTYILGTVVGIIPGAFVYSLFGAGLGSVIAQGEDISLQGVLTPEMIGALVGLAILSLLPVAYKKLRGRSGRK